MALKYFVFSDLHGSSRGLELLRVAIEREKPDIIVCLGDILYGAYDGDTNGCAEYLSSLGSKLVAVRGNCDFSSDGNRIGAFLPEERILSAFGHRLLLQHVPYWRPLKPGDIAMCGHTHIKALYEDGGVIHLNPGSIGKPRDGSYSYALIEEKGIVLMDAETQENISLLPF